MIPAALWLIFSAGTLPVAKAPTDCIALLDAGLIMMTMVGKIPCYCVAPKGYGKVVRL